MNRISSSIPGLDRLIGGGFPVNDVILLSGGCGTGKTVFGLQFVCFSGERGIYISFEDEPDEIRSIADSFKWDIDKLEEKNKLRIVKFDPYQLEDAMDLAKNNIKEMDASCVVIDSVSSLGTYIKDTAELRRNILLI
ncbi:MAG: ATPase domain-containing protein, partial [Candidatus Aenigmarchaeota archaeon]|nr:ATPase domain-containing protein [Candidatus Aenigmarchaeota archaeon]MDI6722290.1 ATPase domain-containing protein [Candidatus Aenigmarchaeota archaeon]